MTSIRKSGFNSSPLPVLMSLTHLPLVDFHIIHQRVVITLFINIISGTSRYNTVWTLIAEAVFPPDNCHLLLTGCHFKPFCCFGFLCYKFFHFYFVKKLLFFYCLLFTSKIFF